METFFFNNCQAESILQFPQGKAHFIRVIIHAVSFTSIVFLVHFDLCKSSLTGCDTMLHRSMGSKTAPDAPLILSWQVDFLGQSLSNGKECIIFVAVAFQACLIKALHGKVIA
jgi:hypothetical protein